MNSPLAVAVLMKTIRDAGTLDEPEIVAGGQVRTSEIELGVLAIKAAVADQEDKDGALLLRR